MKGGEDVYRELSWLFVVVKKERKKERERHKAWIQERGGSPAPKGGWEAMGDPEVQQVDHE